jgi:hypothetical protein
MGKSRKTDQLFRLLLVFLAFVGVAACSSEAPMDAKTRDTIDSTATSQISLARKELDSLCSAAEKTKLPQLVDSIKKVRQREIEQQLKNILK